MKKTISILILLFLMKIGNAQTENFYIPTYSFGPQSRTTGSEIDFPNTGNPIGNTVFNSDDNSRIHIGQNAWFENGVKVFHVISYNDGVNGAEIYDRNNNKIFSETEQGFGSHEIGIFKVSCSVFHIIMGGSVYVLILEPYNGNSHGFCFKAFDLEDAGTPQYVGANVLNSCLRWSANYPIAISKPAIEDITLKKFYLIYYGAGASTSGGKPTIRAERVYYELNNYTGITSSPHYFSPLHGQQGVLFNNVFPYGYSMETEMELSPDGNKLGIVENNAIKVLDLINFSVLTYDLGSSAFPANYPNYGAVLCNSINLKFQACGIEFDLTSTKLFFSCFSMPDHPVYGGGIPLPNCIAVWNFNLNTVDIIPITTYYFEPTDLEMTKDGEIIAISNGALIKINTSPPYNSTIFAGSAYSFGPSGFKTLCHLQGMSGCGSQKIYPKNKIYTLPDQIDGMDYALFNTDKCCDLPTEILAQVDEYIVTSDETWEHDDVLYNNLVIRDGQTLLIKNCIINFRANAKIIVEAGGKLFVDNAKLTNECGALWPGIEVQSDVVKPYNANSEGFVQLFNNSIIEHATQAVVVSEHGILYAQSGTKILNCLNGIKFTPCTDIADNLSYVQDVTFECSTLIPTQSTGTLKFLEFSEISWSGVYGCTFKCTLPYTALNANNRGIGVEIYNSDITFHKTHNVYNQNTTCFDQFGLYNTFINLTYGIHYSSSIDNSKHLVVDYAHFYNCQSSIEIINSGESHITNCIFILDQNFVYQPRPYLDFIHLNNVNGYHIAQNSFAWHEPLSVSDGLIGARVEGTSLQLPSIGGKFRNNIFTYDNSQSPATIPDVIGIHLNTLLYDIEVEWNIFNALRTDWHLTNICAIKDQTSFEDLDPHNRWSQAPYTDFHINNNGTPFDYWSNTNYWNTPFDPRFPSSLTCTKVLFPYTSYYDVSQDLIICPYPTFDAAWGVNSIVRVPKNNINITILPNPVDFNLHYLSYEIKNVEMVNELTIIANDGKEVYHKSNLPASGKININECNLNPGIYYIQTISKFGVMAKKFIVR